MGVGFYDFKLKCWNKLKLWHQWTHNSEGLILWSYVELSSSVDPSTHELDPELFLRFQVETSKKLLELDPGWFYDFKLTCWGKLVELDSGLFYDFK